jgi:hypothetical protein
MQYIYDYGLMTTIFSKNKAGKKPIRFAEQASPNKGKKPNK